jgi:photosystem II stability/assembly factor-like uncharacterized protein
VAASGNTRLRIAAKIFLMKNLFCDNFSMRCFPVLLFFAAASALAQSAPQTRFSRTNENLRGVSTVSEKIAWASGTNGTYLRTTDGRIWIPEQVPGAETLDFRAVVAFSADEAFLMSAGPGDQSRIYHTADSGRHWSIQFTNTNPKGFFDSIVFWDRTHGVVLGDPIPDEAGNLKFELLTTEDGETWTLIPAAQLPPALEGEGAFAASNSCLAILPSLQSSESGTSAPRRPSENERSSASDPNIWFATGGKAARVFHSTDRGHSWQVFDTPIVHGTDSDGIFSIAFRDANHGVIAGGDYKHPDRDGLDLAFTNNGGRTWTLSQIFPQYYYSAVAYDRGVGNPNSKNLNDNQAKVRLFIIGPKSIYDFRPPRNPTRISPRKASGTQFNAVSPFPNGGALVVGPKGSMAIVP